MRPEQQAEIGNKRLVGTGFVIRVCEDDAENPCFALFALSDDRPLIHGTILDCLRRAGIKKTTPTPTETGT